VSVSDSFFDYTASGAPGGGSFLGACTVEEWEMIHSHAERTRVPAGTTIVTAGSLDRCLSIVLDGTVECFAEERGEPVSRSEHSVGSVIGELEFFDGQPATATVRAVTEAELLRLPLERFDVLAAKDPHLALYVLAELGRVVTARLRSATGARRR
jgi:CRP-like cAMP-binding protein